MLLSPHSGFIDGLVMLVPHVVDQHSSIVESSCKKSRRRGMPIEAHDSSWQALVFVLREGDILEGPDQDLPGFLFCEVIATK